MTDALVSARRGLWLVSLSLLVVLGCILTEAVLPDGSTVAGQSSDGEQDVIKWVDFTPTAQAMKQCLSIDLQWQAQGSEHRCSWIELLALYSARCGGDYSKFRAKDLQELAEKIEGGSTPEQCTKNTDLYHYYLTAYSAALGGMVGEYTKVTVTTDADGVLRETRENCYGLRVFSPIGAGYSYTDYDDFGTSRSYGYRRSHLGHDLLGSIGTPIVAIESGVIEHLGWNQYGGWRIGVRSFDGLRYYYYAHLRAGHPYADLYEGKIVHAGEVIGYLGMTGYSKKEDTNGIQIPHLHLGLQLIFKQSQIDGWNQIWLDLYQLMRFWGQNTSKSSYDEARGERIAAVYYEYPEEPD